jgi:thioredoxin reductase (NADPH)
MAPRKGCVPWSWKVRRQAVRPGRLQRSRTISDFQAAFPAMNSPIALQQAKRLGAEILVTRSVQRIDPASREVFLDGDDVVHARTVILATGVSWRKLAIKGRRPAHRQGHLLRSGAQRSGRHQRTRRPPHRRGEFRGAGGFELRQPCAHGDAHCPRGFARKSMSQYLIEQLHRKSNIAVQLQSGRSMATRT